MSFRNTKHLLHIFAHSALWCTLNTAWYYHYVLHMKELLWAFQTSLLTDDYCAYKHKHERESSQSRLFSQDTQDEHRYSQTHTHALNRVRYYSLTYRQKGTRPNRACFFTTEEHHQWDDGDSQLVNADYYYTKQKGEPHNNDFHVREECHDKIHNALPTKAKKTTRSQIHRNQYLTPHMKHRKHNSQQKCHCSAKIHLDGSSLPLARNILSSWKGKPVNQRWTGPWTPKEWNPRVRQANKNLSKKCKIIIRFIFWGHHVIVNAVTILSLVSAICMQGSSVGRQRKGGTTNACNFTWTMNKHTLKTFLPQTKNLGTWESTTPATSCARPLCFDLCDRFLSLLPGVKKDYQPWTNARTNTTHSMRRYIPRLHP